MKQEEKGQAAPRLPGTVDGLVVYAHAGGIGFSDGEQIDKIKNADKYALEPIEPDNGGKTFGMAFIIINAPEINNHQQPEGGVCKKTFQSGVFINVLCRQEGSNKCKRVF